jgi:hypothetical protein
MELKAKLTETLLQSPFDRPAVELDTTASGRVGGYFLSGSFAGMEQMARQEMLCAWLDSKLPIEDRRRIVSIITLTHEELEAAS